MCVCTDHPNALHMLHNCQRFFRRVFWNKKKEKRSSRLRGLLEGSFLVVLEFAPCSSRGALGQVCVEDSGCVQEDDWDIPFQEAFGVSARCPDKPVFFHIGKVNFTTMHFAGIQLDMAHKPCDDSDARLLRPCKRDEWICFNDVELFANVLDLNLAWLLRLHTISTEEQDWALATSEELIPIVPAHDCEEFIIWQGDAKERERRKVLSERKNRKRPAQKSQPAARKRRAGQPGGAQQVTRKALRQGGQAAEEEVASEGSCEDDLELPARDLYEDEDEGGRPDDEDAQDLSERNAGDELLEAVHSQDAGAEAAESREQENEPRDDEFEAFLQEEALAEAQAAAEVPPPEPPEERRQAPRRGPVARSTINRTVFAVPHGELHFYHLTGKMAAFCGNRDSLHASDCRKQSSTTPGSKCRSGRPIGYLMAWLQKKDEFDNRASHIHLCVPSLEDRQQARAAFNALPRSATFAGFEHHKPRPSDPDEPEQF